MAEAEKVVTRAELDQINARKAAREAQTTAVNRVLPIDEAAPGGRYLVGGVLVDSDGKSLKG